MLPRVRAMFNHVNPNHVYLVFWLLEEVSTGAWLFWYPFWPNKIFVVNLLKNPLGAYPLRLLWDHWAHSQSCWQGDAEQDHRILPVLKYIVMLKLSSHTTIYNLLIRLNKELLIKFHLMETLVGLMTISSGSIWIHLEGHLPRTCKPQI